MAYGYDACSIDRLDGALSEFDVVVNTVPAPIFGGNALKQLKPGCLCVDVASIRGIDGFGSGGSWPDHCLGAALPGKLMPCTAGMNHPGYGFEILKEQGVIL